MIAFKMDVNRFPEPYWDDYYNGKNTFHDCLSFIFRGIRCGIVYWGHR